MDTGEPLARRGRREGPRRPVHPVWKFIAIVSVVMFSVVFVLCVVNLTSFTTGGLHPSPKGDKQEHSNTRRGHKYTITSKAGNDNSSPRVRIDNDTADLSHLQECLQNSGYGEGCRDRDRHRHRIINNPSARWHHQIPKMVVRETAREEEHMHMPIPPPRPGRGTDPLEICYREDECRASFDELLACVKARFLNPSRDCEAEKKVLQDAVRRAMEKAKKKEGGGK